MSTAQLLSAIRWGPPTAAGQAAFKKLREDGLFFLATNKDGSALPDPGFGDRATIDYIQRWAWNRAKEQLRRMDAQRRSKPGIVNTILFASRSGKHKVEVNGTFTGTFVTRDEALGRSEFLPEDIIEYRSVEPPMIDGKPAGYLLFVQNDKYRAIIGNLRPETHPDWHEWPADEKSWARDAYGQNSVLWQYGHVASAIESRLSEHRVPFSVGVKPEPMAAVLDAIRASEDVDEALETAFSSLNWDAPIDEWRMNPQWARRLPIFQDAIRALRAGAPGAAVVELLAQLEGVIMDYLLRFGDGVDAKGRSLRWDDVMGQLERRVGAEELGPVRRLAVGPTLAYLRRSGVYQKFSWTEASSGFNRHSILHGQNVEYATAANAIRALLALDALYWITGFQYRVPKPPR